MKVNKKEKVILDKYNPLLDCLRNLYAEASKEVNDDTKVQLPNAGSFSSAELRLANIRFFKTRLDVEFSNAIEAIDNEAKKAGITIDIPDIVNIGLKRLGIEVPTEGNITPTP